MTLSTKHSKVSSIPDGADATLVRPSDWNAEHALTVAGPSILGKTTAGAGAVAEIALPGGTTDFLRADGAFAAPVGTDTFTELTDCPPSYAGNAGKHPRVNTGETALEFAALPSWANGEMALKPTAKSTVATDDPIYRQFILYLR